MTKSFKTKEHYSDKLEEGYSLLPCRFIPLDQKRYVLTNLVGEYLVVDRDSLLQFLRHQLASEASLYNELKSKHFLVDSDSRVGIDLLALKYRTRSLNLANFTALHMFVVTLRCEHSCPYCQVSRQSEDRQAFDMSMETADRALDFVFQSPSPDLKIEFQGGESLLNFELIKHIVERAESINSMEMRNLDFVIATNLAVLEDEHLEYAQKHNIYFSVSLDGPKELHNANRPRPGGDSYERTVSGIEKVRRALGPDKVSALMTTTESSLGQVQAIVDAYVEQGFPGIFLRPLSPYGFAVKTKWFDRYDVSEWLDFYFAGLDYIIELNKSGIQFAEYYAGIVLEKMFSHRGTGYVDLQSPAGIGISAIVYNYDGDVYASDEARMLAEMNDKSFRLGSLYDDSYQDIISSEVLLSALEDTLTESVPGCTDCGFQVYCGSDPLYHHATQQDKVGHKALSGFCKKNMAIFRRLITIMEDDPSAREILLSWVRR